MFTIVILSLLIAALLPLFQLPILCLMSSHSPKLHPYISHCPETISVGILGCHLNQFIISHYHCPSSTTPNLRLQCCQMTCFLSNVICIYSLSSIFFLLSLCLHFRPEVLRADCSLPSSPCFYYLPSPTQPWMQPIFHNK